MCDDTFWWKHGIIYQIYPRSFMDRNGDGIGDLTGIYTRLDYLVELGIDAVWLSPIYPSPMADFGYDISNHMDIDPIFGDLGDFDFLLSELHQRGIRLVLDYVPNHTSIEHPWFLESRQSQDNPKREWYVWKDPKPDWSPPNNWEAVVGGSAWNWDPSTGQYYLSQFIKEEPDLNWRNPAVVAAMQDVLQFWLDKGVDGFRMDMLPYLVEHPDFPDNPPLEGEHPFRAIGLTLEQKFCMDQPETHAIIQKFRRLIDNYPGERVIIGETPLFDLKKLASYYGRDFDEVHIPFNFPLLLSPWNAKEIRNVLEQTYDAVPEGAEASIVFGNHDFSRIASRFGAKNVKSAAVLLLTLCGVPTLYYGDEIGMHDVSIPPEKRQDPMTAGGSGRDPERTPMQWDDSPNTGFCPVDVEPWLPIAEDCTSVNVASQRDDPNSNLNLYKRLIHLRKENPTLNSGTISFLGGIPENILAYKRCLADHCVLVLVNFEGGKCKFGLSGLGHSGQILVSTELMEEKQVSLGNLELKPNQSLVLKINDEE